MSRRAVRVLVACWLASRLLLVALALGPPGYPAQLTVLGDVRQYSTWADGFTGDGRAPLRDADWEYPAGSAVPVLLPKAVPGGYLGGWLVEAVVVDGAILGALLWLGRRGGSWRGAAFWLAATAALGPVAVVRLDAFASLLAVLGVVALGSPLLAGLALGGGVAAKLWPAALLVAATTRANARRLYAGAAASLAAVVAAVAAFGGLGRVLSFAGYHAHRGLQVEAVAATPLLWTGARADLRYGAIEVLGGGVGTALAVTAVATVAAVAAFLLLVRRRPDPVEAAAAGVLLVLVAGKVLSPQFLLWPFVLVGAALCRDGSRLRAAAPWLVAAAALTHVVYPLRYVSLWHDHALPVVAVQTVRNAILLGVALWAVRAVWRST
ncbi:MAG TPA: glycosyltransferase 87 family protein [Mycobacteriales bacterium]|nr:glycosyltransferase 87 family protein [Mycobacteriales bacterium]